MYQYLWNKMPGHWVIKLVITLALLVGVFFLLMEVVYPWISSMMPYNDVAV